MVEIAPVVKAFNLINYVPHIKQAAESGDTIVIEQYKLRMSGALDLYSL